MTMLNPNDLPITPDWVPETRAWDDLKCCPAECVACDVPANVVLSDN